MQRHAGFAVALVLLPTLYFAGYFVMRTDPGANPYSISTASGETAAALTEDYRFGGEWAKGFFKPANWVDRRFLRPQRWIDADDWD
jgi:hypothetical protein